MTDRPEAFIDAWQLWTVGGTIVLRGLVTGHPRLAGRRRAMQTSPLVRLDLGNRTARTRHTLYRLGRHLDALVRDDAGEPQLVALGGLFACRQPGTNLWRVIGGTGIRGSFTARDIHDVLGHLLDVELSLDDLIHQIRPDNLPDLEW
jgi:hypothetical protein